MPGEIGDLFPGDGSGREVTLAEYAAQHAKRRGTECGACILRREVPELWEQVLRGRRQQVSNHTIAGFLRSRGRQITFNQIRDHFQKEHD